MQTPVIVSACRTPIGKFGKSLVGVHAARLGATVVEAPEMELAAIAAALRRSGLFTSGP